MTESNVREMMHTEGLSNFLDLNPFKLLRKWA